MKEKLQLTGAIVLFNEDIEELKVTISSFLRIPLKKKLYLIDNTAEKKFQNIFNQDDIEYIATSKNVGFGAGHNRIIDKVRGKSRFHLILNPDVSFNKSIVPNLIKELENDVSLALIAPKVLFPSGEHQYSCRRYPQLLELIARRFGILKPLFKSLISRGIYKDKDLNTSFYAEYLAGCFHLYKTDDFISLQGFDERYFLYMEDVDICKKIDVLGKRKLYQPNEEITHVLKQGSLKNMRLLFRHSSSAIKYFLKWSFK